MPIDSLHPKYSARQSQWKKCRDAFEGEDAIKDAGELYLPRLKGQDDTDYKNYKRRALFYSITSKSVSALVGMATSKNPKLVVPESMDMYFKGSTVIQFSEVYSTLLAEILLQSRCGILVDMPEVSGEPYPVIYQAEDIINWRTDSSGNILFVVLRESYDSVGSDEYEVTSTYRLRELRLFEGLYIQNVYDDKGELVESIIPMIRGVQLDYIPFFIANPFGTGFGDHKPLMLDIANINLSHYLSSADLEHGRHFTGLPTPVLIGASADQKLYIGSTKFLILPDKGGDAKYLEFTGQGLQSLEKAMSEKQGLLASLSARLLDNSSRGSEAADAVKLRYMSETASLTTVVNAAEIVLNSTYKLIALIIGENPDDVTIDLDTDFMETVISAPDMSALFDGFFKGAVSKETLIYNMRKGRRLDPSRTDKQEVDDIETSLKAAKDAELKSAAKQPTQPVVKEI